MILFFMRELLGGDEMNIGEKIKKRRKELGLSVDELAKRLNKNRATVYRYESDEVELPLPVLQPLADALKVNPSYLLGWEPIGETHSSYEYRYFSSIPMDDHLFHQGYSLKDKRETIRLPDSVMGKWAKREDIFMLRMQGDTMNRVMPNGSLLAVKCVKYSELTDNDIVVFKDKTGYFVRRFFTDTESQKIAFRSDSYNKKYFDYVLSHKEAKELTLYGKVVLYIAELD